MKNDRRTNTALEEQEALVLRIYPAIPTVEIT